MKLIEEMNANERAIDFNMRMNLAKKEEEKNKCVAEILIVLDRVLRKMSNIQIDNETSACITFILFFLLDE